MIAAAKKLDNHIPIARKNDENIEDIDSRSNDAQYLNDITEQQELETILSDDDIYKQLFNIFLSQ